MSNGVMLNNMQAFHKKSYGFSLIELSIVLVIIGLIAGGIVGGVSLIRAAGIQNLIKQKSQWLTAYNAFVLQYNAKPGDFAEGFDYWDDGTALPCGPDNTTISGCNGDGDGVLGGGNTVDVTENMAELQRAWMHLEQADILNGQTTTYKNLASYRDPAPTECSGSCSGMDNSIPDAKGAEGTPGWQFFNPLASGLDTAPSIFGRAGTWLLLGSKAVGAQGNHMFEAALTPKDAASIDKKTDDGVPTMGSVTAATGANVSTECASVATNYGNMDTVARLASHTYNLSNTAVSCYQLFFVGN